MAQSTGILIGARTSVPDFESSGCPECADGSRPVVGDRIANIEVFDQDPDQTDQFWA